MVVKPAPDGSVELKKKLRKARHHDASSPKARPGSSSRLYQLSAKRRKGGAGTIRECVASGIGPFLSA